MPFGAATTRSHAPFGVLGHKMTNDTKGSQFQAQGVLQPLLVRTIEDDKYEVIAGARRLRAAKLAALEEVPVRVVELSDAACVETQLVELSVVGKSFLC